MAYKPLAGYPTSAWGHTKVSSGDYFGPANYQQPGDTVIAGSFGFAGLEEIGFSGGGNSQSNNYYVKVIYPATSNSNELFAPAYGQNASAANNTNAPVVQWYYSANNNQVANNANLSAEVVRYRVYGV